MARLLLLVGAIAMVHGCSATAPRTSGMAASTPLVSQQGLAGADAAGRSEFWYRLARAPVATNDDAFHALLLYFADGDPAADYAGRVAEVKRRKMLSATFDRPAGDCVERGTLAAAIAEAASIRGGLSMRLFGNGPRYADRALQYRGLLPAGSPNQVLTGGQLVAVLGRVEDLQRGDPAEARAALLPGEIGKPAAPPSPDLKSSRPGSPETSRQNGNRDSNRDFDFSHPLTLNVISTDPDRWWFDATTAPSDPAAVATPTPSAPVKLKAVVTGIEGDLVEVRKSAADPWQKARLGQSLNEGSEFRTGPKSAVRFVIPPNQVYTLDRQGTCSVLQAVYDGQKVKADIGMDQGRVRLDVAPIATPIPSASPSSTAPSSEDLKLNPGGVQYGINLRSPNAVLAVRGTLVSLYDEPGFTPEAVSLTGQAQFQNTKRQLVAFGGKSGRTKIRGDQGSAAEQSFLVATTPPGAETTRNDFDAQQTAFLLNRGGLERGDVLVGNSRITDAALVPTLPGALNFVLRWDGGPSRTLNDLNLAVFSPLHTATSPDFVANPPFTLSLTPDDPSAEATRQQLYPRTSASGGRISKNHVGPEGLEFASWKKDYPAGNYKVVVYNLLDAVPPPTTTDHPVAYSIDVFLNKRVLINTVTGSVGQLQTSAPVVVPVPAATASAKAASAGTGSKTRLAADRYTRVR